MMAVPLPVSAAFPKIANILLPTDLSADSLPVLPYAGHIARAFAAKVHLCHIQAEVPLAAGLAAPRLYEAAGKQAAEQMDALRASPHLHSVEQKLLLVAGTIRDSMPAIISANHIDLIAVGTHGRTGLAKVVLGSVAEEICRVATCPVLTAGPATESMPATPFKKILFPTNLSEISRKALPCIALLAGKYRSLVKVLHVIPESAVAGADRDKKIESLRARMAQDFGPALAQFQPEFMVAFGSTADAVLNVSRDQQTGLIALGIRNAFRPGILVERTAYRIMAGAPCPVLTVP
jgi:nucleotide-binding universal stress UspA family protein